MNATQQISHTLALSAVLAPPGLVEDRRLNPPAPRDVTDADIAAKVRELKGDEGEWDNVAVEVLDSGRFVEILKQCLDNPDLAGMRLRRLVNEQWEQRAEDLLS